MSDFHDYPRRYVGARYVPQFADPIKWDINRSYEALTIVDYGDNRYTSKMPVPVGVDIGNTVYWVLTGASNEKLDHYIVEAEGYREEVGEYQKAVDEYKEAVDDYHDEVGKYHDEVVNLTEVVNVNNTLVGEYKETVDNYQSVAEGYRDDVDKYRQEVGEYKENVEGYHEELNEFMISIDEKLAGLGGDFTWYDLKNELPISDLGATINSLINEGYNGFILPYGEYTWNTYVETSTKKFALVGSFKPHIIMNRPLYLSVEYSSIYLSNISVTAPTSRGYFGGKIGFINSLIEDCEFTDCDDDIFDSSFTESTIQNCTFKNNGIGGYGDALIPFLNHGKDVVVKNCVFEGNKQYCIVGHYVDNCIVDGCIFKGHEGTLACVHAGYSGVFTNNILENIPCVGVQLYSGSNLHHVVNNQFINCKCAIYASSSSGVLSRFIISNNTFVGCDGTDFTFDNRELDGNITMGCSITEVSIFNNMTISEDTKQGKYLVYVLNNYGATNTMISGNNAIGTEIGVTNLTEDAGCLFSNNNWV